jgi:hypothetical protein
MNRLSLIGIQEILNLVYDASRMNKMKKKAADAAFFNIKKSLTLTHPHQRISQRGQGIGDVFHAGGADR